MIQQSTYPCSVCQVCNLPANLTIKNIPGNWCRDHLPITGLVINFIHHALKQINKSLKEDDPKGNCAAHHRGEKAALKLILEYLERPRF